MHDVLAVTLQSMHTDMVRMEHVGMNLANTLTPGYKRQVAVVRPFADFMSAMHASVASEAAQAVASSTMNILSDVRPGMLKATGQNLDLALTGAGYFEVSTDNGSAYTRQGNFHIDARGRLVTAQGYPVMGKNGEIQLNSGTPVAVDASGQIVEMNHQDGQLDNRSIAQLKIVQFDDPAAVRRSGDGMVTAESGVSLMNDADIQVSQGALENSNVSTMHEMVQLMQIMRHFESMQKIAQGHDEMIGSAIRKLGDM